MAAIDYIHFQDHNFFRDRIKCCASPRAYICNMELPFWKYQGTGNDFIMLYDPELLLDRNDTDKIARLCHRRFGIGADGLISAEQTQDGQWFMRYYNSDGRPSTFCGNGGRCFARFLHDRGLFTGRNLEFQAVDGQHEATVESAVVRLRMRMPYQFEEKGKDRYFIHTGSPHIVQFIPDPPESFDLIPFARSIRYHGEYKEDGVNVNIAWTDESGTIWVRTYERGVEDETWSCGTGVTAVASVHAILTGSAGALVRVSTPGGLLSVQTGELESPWLIGPAVQVFEGKVMI